jgi:integrase
VTKRREYGEGSVYQRSSDGLFVATIDVAPGANGKRRRITVSAKTRPAALKKLRDKRVAIEASGVPTQAARTTVKQWAATWLEIKQRTLSPRGYNAAASPVRKWIVPTIGHRRLDALTPADLRAVADAQREAGRSGSTAAATHRVLLNMLRSAIVEGHQVPQRVLLVPAPKASKSDRMDLPVDQALACLQVAATLPHGTRWALSIIYGARQGEALGLTWDSIDFEAGEITLEWQLDNLPYRVPRDRRSGFRVPDEYDARHLVDAWHLVRLKSRAGKRVLPMTPGLARALLAWREVATPNPWGLVWCTVPEARGGVRPANDRHDLEEWHAIQGAASLLTLEPRTDLGPIQVGHPGGRYFHVHECRNLAATQLGETGADPEVIKSLLGHATAAMSGEYRRIHKAPKLEAIERVAELLPFEPTN